MHRLAIKTDNPENKTVQVQGVPPVYLRTVDSPVVCSPTPLEALLLHQWVQPQSVPHILCNKDKTIQQK
jgi:hypothetical protein